MSTNSTYSLRDVITAALRLISVTDSNQTLDGPMVAQGLYTAQEIMDSFNAQGNLIYAQTISTFQILSQKQTYTIGPDLSNGVSPPDFIVPARPQSLIYAAFQPSNTSPPINLQLDLISATEWSQLVSKSVYSSIPSKLFFDQTFPIGNINLWNIPSQDGALVLTYWQPLPSWGLTLDTIIQNTLPPAYMRLLRYELAMNLAPEYGKSVPVDIASIVDSIKRDLAINNAQSDYARYIGPSGAGVYDAVSGNTY